MQIEELNCHLVDAGCQLADGFFVLQNFATLDGDRTGFNFSRLQGFNNFAGFREILET